MVDFVLNNIEWLLLLIVFISSVLSVLQIASLLSFYAVLVLFMDADAIVPIATMFYLSMNITKMIIFRSDIDWCLVKKLVLSSIPGLIAGSLLIAYIPTSITRQIIACLVIIFLIIEIFKIKNYEIKNTGLAIIIVGLVYGFLSGLIGSGGMVRTPLLMKMGLSKSAFIGTAAAASLFSNIIKMISYSINGLITGYVLVNGFFSMLIGVIGAQIGKYLLKYVKDKSFKWILQIGLLITAILSLI